MSRYWGKNIVIDGSKIKEQFKDPLPVMGPPLVVTAVCNSSLAEVAAFEGPTQDLIRQIADNSVGKVLTDAINAAPQVLTIRPLNEMAIGLTGAVADDDDAATSGGTWSNVT